MERVLFATGVIELLRPLFVRWASDDAIAVYETVIATLRRDDAGPADAALLRASIDALPESEHDDSHYRDYYVATALGVLSYASMVALSPASDTSADDVRWFESVVEAIAHQLDLRASVEALRDEAATFASRADIATGKPTMRIRAEELAPMVHTGLDTLARDNRWSLDRVRPGPGEASTRFLTVDVWVARKDHGSVREHATFEDVEVALVRLDAKMWTLLYIGGAGEPHLCIGGGDGQYGVYMGSAGEEELWNLVSAEPKEGTVMLMIGGQGGGYPARQVVGLEEARTAARTFFLRRERDPSLRWERQ